MPSLCLVRFPSGTEHWYAETAPQVGQAIVRGGVRYVVTQSEQEDDGRWVVTVSGEEPRVGSLPFTEPSSG